MDFEDYNIHLTLNHSEEIEAFKDYDKNFDDYQELKKQTMMNMKI